ncbi:hypothetical protein ACFCT7_07120 [Fulvivirgaceae bacterium LMO-SS25]
MNKLKTLFLAVVVAFVAIACESGPTEEEQQNSLKDEVMEIHDEVMPKMGEMNTLKNELLADADSLSADSSNVENLELSIDLKQIASELEEANKSMMDWMRNYKPTFDEQTHEEIMQYLEDQKVKAGEVKTKILTSIEKAKAKIAKKSEE